MKNKKICPKCGSKDILLIQGGMESSYYGNVIRVGITMLNIVEVKRYVCCDCGFSEEWIDLEDIPKLRKKFEE